MITEELYKIIRMRVSCIVEENVLRKMDTQFIEQWFKEIGDNIAITFICTNENWRKEDKWRKKKIQYYTIRLPYEEVLNADDARPIMVKAVKERLGLTETNPLALPLSNGGTEALA